MEYQREFVRLVNCIPFVIRDESHKAQLFVDGLRSEIFQVVQAADLHTFQRVVDRPTIVERGLTVTRARKEGYQQHEDRKQSQPQSGGGSFIGNRPPKRWKSRRGTRSAPTGGERTKDRPCIICGGAHRVTDCLKRQDHCFRCGKPGHFHFNCPLLAGAATSAASTPLPHPTGRGRAPSGTASRSSAPRQEGEAKPQSGGRVYFHDPPGD